MKTIYLAEHKETKELHSFTWTEDNSLLILGVKVNPNDYNIVQYELKEINNQ